MMFHCKIVAVVFCVAVIAPSSSGRCNETYNVVCPGLNDFVHEEQTTWQEVVIKPKYKHTQTIELYISLMLVQRVHNLLILDHMIKVFGFNFFTCQYTSNIKYLSFYENIFPQIPSDSFHIVGKSLEKLFLRRNQIQAIDVGAFKGNNITILDLSENQIEFIQKGTFPEEGIRALHLHQNKINHIDPVAFPLDLRILRLDNNALRFLDQQTFSNLTNLRLLNLARNELLQMPNMQDLKNLKELDLSHNNIKVVQGAALANIESLTVLDLGFNKIQVLDFLDAFLRKHSQAYVSIAFNQLQSLRFNYTADANFEKNALVLYGNLWQCNDFDAMEAFLMKAKIQRGSCDLRLFNTAQAPFCMFSEPVFAKDAVTVALIDRFTKALSDVKDTCDLSAQRDENFYLFYLYDSYKYCINHILSKH